MSEKIWLASYPEGVKRTTAIDLPDMSLIDILFNAANEKPDHIGLVFNESKFTYKQIEEKVARLATGLNNRGVKKGSRVALMMNNCPDLIFSYFAVLYCGGIVVQNNPMYKERELIYQLNDSKSELLIIEASLLEELSSIKNEEIKIIISRTESHKEFETINDLVKENKHIINPASISPKQDIAALQYTAGTTGLSKGVKLSHHNLVSNVVQVDTFLGVNCKVGEEKVLNVLPLFHVYGMTVSMNFCFYMQSTLFLVERFEPKEILSLIDKEKITMFPGTPTIYVAVNNDDDVKKYDLSSIHTCISGSAPLSREIKSEFESISGAKLVDAYGLSEASPVTHSNPVNGLQKPGSMGLPVPGTDCKIVDEEDGMTEKAIGEPGELIVKGPQVMLGYWEKEEETKEALRDGWLYTGDIAYMDEDGYCFIVSRKKDVIIASGYNVYPREIEEVLFEHPSVKEVIVCGIPHSYRGETPKAFVVLSGKHKPVSEEEIRQFCVERMAKYKVPTNVEFMDELPKSSVGKILRRELIEREKTKMNQEL